jgi:hypothetical protein
MTEVHDLVPVTRQQLDAIERAGGKDSFAYKRLREQYEAWQGYLARNKAEGETIRQRREAERAAAIAERQAAAQAQRAAEAAAARAVLERELKRAFFTTNPSATDADWARFGPQLIDAELVRRTVARFGL